MNSFSQRKGLKPIKSVIQVNSIDNELRNGLWNGLTLFYWNRIKDQWIKHYPNMEILLNVLWHSYFRRPVDTLNDFWPKTHKVIRKFFFTCEWYDVYDFIEFIANRYQDDLVNQKFIQFCNIVLKTELSAYRFVDNKIVQITSEVEISEIEEALGVSETLRAVNTHLKRSLELLADKNLQTIETQLRNQ